ncbi:hypothetical protein HZ326_24279 [Fusarium oxysporum f. sp. albedinis]|nr:hypothetical protein HZ326_24279 [Fusarium oxysporum f. sp. albedinis]
MTRIRGDTILDLLILGLSQLLFVRNLPQVFILRSEMSLIISKQSEAQNSSGVRACHLSMVRLVSPLSMDGHRW